MFVGDSAGASSETPFGSMGRGVFYIRGFCGNLRTVKLHISHNNRRFFAHLDNPISLALGFGPDAENPNAFHINPGTF